MIILFINDKRTSISFPDLKEGKRWIDTHTSPECYPNGFTTREFFDSATLTYYNLVEEKD
jgi:hypothetical protein